MMDKQPNKGPPRKNENKVDQLFREFYAWERSRTYDNFNEEKMNDEWQKFQKWRRDRKSGEKGGGGT